MYRSLRWAIVGVHHGKTNDGTASSEVLRYVMDHSSCTMTMDQMKTLEMLHQRRLSGWREDVWFTSPTGEL